MRVAFTFAPSKLWKNGNTKKNQKRAMGAEGVCIRVRGRSDRVRGVIVCGVALTPGGVVEPNGGVWVADDRGVGFPVVLGDVCLYRVYVRDTVRDDIADGGLLG